MINKTHSKHLDKYYFENMVQMSNHNSNFISKNYLAQSSYQQQLQYINIFKSWSNWQLKQKKGHKHKQNKQKNKTKKLIWKITIDCNKL